MSTLPTTPQYRAMILEAAKGGDADEVAQITEKSLKDVLEVRRALDAFIAELACERITDEELIKLKKAAKDFEAATKEKDTTTLASTDVAFHDIIIEATGNVRLKQLVNNLAEQMYRYRFVYLADESSHEGLVREHKTIYEAILKRDKKAASNAARLHIDNQEKAIIEHLKKEKERDGK